MNKLLSLFSTIKKRWIYLSIVLIVIIVGLLIVAMINKPIKKLLYINIQPIRTTMLWEIMQWQGQVPPQKLTIYFYSKKHNQPASVAPFNKLDKTLTKNIQLSPKVAGQWRWGSDDMLVFTPTQLWPAGKSYTIRISNKLFSNHWKLNKHAFKFSTPGFKSTIQSARFYLNPKNPQIKKIVSTVAFNYPVNQNTIRNNIKMSNQNNEIIPYTYNLGPYKRRLYIHSNDLNLQQQAQFIKLTVKKGIKTTQGGVKLVNKSDTTVKVPSMYGLKISNVYSDNSIDKHGNIRQTLSFSTNFGVNNSTLKNHLKLYLLTKQDGETLIKHNWLNNPLMVNKQMLANAKLVDYHMTAATHSYPTNHQISFNAPSNRVLLIKIKNKLVSIGGFELRDNYKALRVVQSLPNKIQFNHKGSLLALTANQTIGLWQRGLHAVKIKIFKIKPNQIYNFISQAAWGSFTNPNFTNPDNFNINNISISTSFIKSFSENFIKQPQQFTIDFHHLKDQFKQPGLYIVKVMGWNPKKKQALSISTSRLVLLTNFGLIVKTNANNSQDVFVQSILTGQPVSHAHVALLGVNGSPIQTAVTNTRGHAYLPKIDLQIEKGLRAPLVYFIKKGNDISLIPYKGYNRKINMTRFNTGGQYINANKLNNSKALTAFIFTDRGLYRPGAIIHFAGIIKQQDWASNNIIAKLDGLPITLTISSASGKTLDKQELRLTDDGLLASKWNSSISSSSGKYYITYYLGNNSKPSQFIGSTIFRIASFTPASMRMRLHFNRRHQVIWTSAKNLSAKIKLMNLFGLPANNNKVEAKLTITPGYFSVGTYPTFTFMDPLSDLQRNITVIKQTLPDEYTNKLGLTSIPLDLTRYADATYNLNLYVQGFQKNGGRAVEAQKSILISPLDYIIGYKTDTNFDYLKSDSQHSVDLVAVNSVGKAIAVPNLTVYLYQQKQISVLMQQQDGTYQYINKTKSVLLNHRTLKLPNHITKFDVDTKLTPGSYKLVIMNNKQRKLAETNYTIVGNTHKASAKHNQLSLHLDKTQYQPGSMIHIAISTPYAGNGLITVVRDKVYTYKWFHSGGGETTQTIQLPRDLQGNAYIEVDYTRSYHAKQTFMNPFSYAIEPFRINHQAHHIAIDLSSKKTVEPGKKLTIHYKTDKPAKIIIFAVDKGILIAANYHTPNPENHYFAKRALQVWTRQTMDLILPRYQRKILSAFGGGASKVLQKHVINPFQSRLNKPVVFWSGILNSSQEQHSVEFTVPGYFNGDLQIMAVAVNKNALGSATINTYSRAKYIIMPNVPKFVAPGDSFDVAVTVTNNNSDKGSDRVSLTLATTSALSLKSKETQIATIPAKASHTFHYKLTANQILGAQKINFIATNGTDESSMQEGLSIRPASLYQFNLTSGFDKSKLLVLKPVHDFYNRYRRLTIAAGFNSQLLVNGLLQKIKHAPITNDNILAAQLLSQINLHQRETIAGNKIQKNLNSFINKIRSWQNTNGSFNCNSCSIDSNKLTLYLANLITLAKQQGYTVPTDLYLNMINYLNSYSFKTNLNTSIPSNIAQSIFLLTENSYITSNAVQHLLQYINRWYKKSWQHSLTGLYIATTYKLMENNKFANQIVIQFISHQKKLSAQALFLLSKYFPKLAKQGLTGKQIQQQISRLASPTSSSLQSAYTVLALEDFNKLVSTTSDSSITITGTNQTNQSNTIANAQHISATHFSPNIKKLSINQHDANGFYYQLITAGYPYKLPKKIGKKGVEVAMLILNQNNRPIHSIKLGDIIHVLIRLRATGKQSINNANIIDLLPSGFQLVRQSVGNYKYNTEYNSVNIRQDRLIFHATIPTNMITINYQLRAVTPGDYVFPPIVVQAYSNHHFDHAWNLAKHLKIQ